MGETKKRGESRIVKRSCGSWVTVWLVSLARHTHADRQIHDQRLPAHLRVVHVAIKSRDTILAERLPMPLDGS